jgi:hypothetical protein
VVGLFDQSRNHPDSQVSGKGRLDRHHAGYAGQAYRLGVLRLDHDRVEHIAVAVRYLDRPAELLADQRGDLGLPVR